MFQPCPASRVSLPSSIRHIVHDYLFNLMGDLACIPVACDG
jgi:hypothetical protein